MHTVEHWQQVYSTKASDAVSWFQKHAVTSLNFIQTTGLGKHATIIDIDGGASTLVDGLLLKGYNNLTVLDLADAGLQAAQARIGPAAAKQINWLVADITQVDLPVHKFDIWHDRAVFHFLTQSEDRLAYIKAMQNAVKPGGYIVLATFALDGPTKCSGLPVVRYSADSLQAVLGDNFTLIKQL